MGASSSAACDQLPDAVLRLGGEGGSSARTISGRPATGMKEENKKEWQKKTDCVDEKKSLGGGMFESATAAGCCNCSESS